MQGNINHSCMSFSVSLSHI